MLLVGGQAVNLWALYYEAHTAELAPFVSRDVDVLGDRETLDALGKIAGAKLALGNTRVQVPGPIALLQAKIANVAEISQTGRQDSRHVVILARLMPAYLGDLQTAAAESRLEERKLIEFLERLLAVISTRPAQRVFDQLRLKPEQLFHRLGDDRLIKLQAFLTKRLPRAIRAQ